MSAAVVRVPALPPQRPSLADQYIAAGDSHSARKCRRDLDTALTGVLYAPRDQPRLGILLIHGGAGLDDHARERAHRHARLGYTVLACHRYGNGVAGERERTMATIKSLRDDRTCWSAEPRLASPR
jgi:dienelactone hydrolase